MKKLYKFYYDTLDINFLSGMFIEDEEVINVAYGKTLFFDLDVLNRYKIKFDESMIEEISVTSQVIKEFESLFKFGDICGHNPLDYIISDEEERALFHLEFDN